MIENLLCSEQLKKSLRNELKNIKESGTYIFYGLDREMLLEVALSFAKALNCLELKGDFCNRCSSCERINSKTHGDLEILSDETGIKIEAVRDLIYKNSISSYEGGGKIFILEDINKMKPAPGNALLKTIEEPSKGSYFFLLTTSLNILPTIKSRGTILKVPQLSPDELEVTKEVYDFFNGSTTDIKKYKASNIDLNERVNYEKIDIYFKEYYKNEKSLEDKVKIYNALRHFVKSYKWISQLDKLIFVENISRECKEREDLYFVLSYIAFLKSEEIDLKKILENKNKMRLPVILKGVLIDIFL